MVSKIQCCAMVGVLLTGLSCQKKDIESAIDSSNNDTVSEKYLYLASGGCYVGSLTAEAASRTISRVNLSTGVIDSVLTDYNGFAPGDQPKGIIPLDSEHILVGIDNSARRVDKINLKSGEVSTHLTNTNINNVIRSISPTPDGGFILSRTNAIEKFSASKSRVTAGSNPWVNAPGGSCATSASIVATEILDNGDIVYLNALAGQNRIGVIRGNTGYTATTDCRAAQSAPNANAFPTAIAVVRGANQILVSYASATVNLDYIYSYDVDPDTSVISNPVKAFENTSVIRGASAMYYDDANSTLYVANGSTMMNNGIEKFTYDKKTKLLTRVSNTTFSMPTIHHRCINAMRIL